MPTVLCLILFWLCWQFFVDSHDLSSNIIQGFFTGTRAIIWLPQCHWSNPEKFGLNHPITDIKIYVWLMECIMISWHRNASTITGHICQQKPPIIGELLNKMQYILTILKGGLQCARLSDILTLPTITGKIISPNAAITTMNAITLAEKQWIKYLYMCIDVLDLARHG